METEVDGGQKPVEEPIAEEEALGLAEQLAGGQEEASANRGAMKATPERVLQFLQGRQPPQEMQVGNVKFSVVQKPEPIKPAKLFAETLRLHYDFKAADVDEFMELVAETKEELASTRPSLVTRLIKPKKMRARKR